MSTPDPAVALARSPDELTLLEYQQLANLTDRSAPSRRTNFDFPLLGLFGEVGSLLAEVKKKQRTPTPTPAMSQPSWRSSAIPFGISATSPREQD